MKAKIIKTVVKSESIEGVKLTLTVLEFKALRASLGYVPPSKLGSYLSQTEVYDFYEDLLEVNV